MKTIEPKTAERLNSYLKLILQNMPDRERILEVAKKGSPLGGLETTAAAAPVDELVKRAVAGAKTLLSGRDAPPEQLVSMEAIILPDLRPAIDVVGGTFNVTHHLWQHLNNKPIRTRLESAMPSIGRIELPGHRQYPYAGTGFVVGDGLLMTNRHVAAIFATGLGDRGLGFKPGHRAGVDFQRERDRGAGRMLEVKRVVMIHPYWDMAILAVEGLESSAKPLKLSLMDISLVVGREIAVVGYPAFDPRNDPDEQDKLFDSAYGVKRLQPGQLHPRVDTESFGKIVSAIAHDCSTLGGNSGSAVIDLESGEIIALHFGGRYRERNYAVPTFELARDGRVVDAGIQFAGQPPGGTPPWHDWWRLDEVAGNDDNGAGSSAQTSPTPGSAPVLRAGADGAFTIEIPLNISVRLGGAAQAVARAEAAAGMEMLERLVEPEHDTDYESRGGYDDRFLGIKVPMPQPRDPDVVAKAEDGSSVLKYQNFSIIMHAARRLALLTAANVTGEKALRRPDPRRKYTRKALSGLGENDQEKWFVDPRLDEKHQLPDVFFNKDRKAFDKGHIVRRDDVAWGKTYEDLCRANGDTYHVTNCSPQSAGFNRSASGEDNWGDLENHVLASAAKERLTLFAGPVLDPSDTVFHGVGNQGARIRAKIPTRYWKVVIAPVLDGDGIAAFGFVLEQDLSDVAFEYVPAEEYVPAAEFVPYMEPLAEIAEMAGVTFDPILLGADQFDTVRGAVVSVGAGARRRRRRR